MVWDEIHANFIMSDPSLVDICQSGWLIDSMLVESKDMFTANRNRLMLWGRRSSSSLAF